ncbi:MAG: hypothetical protein ABIC95_07390 [archaeon]
MAQKKEGQIATEYIIVVGVAFLLLVIFVASFQENFQGLVVRQEQALVKDLAYMVQKEVLMASKVETAYTREFDIPETLLGHPYTIENSRKKVIVRSDNFDFALTIPEVKGSLGKGINLIRSMNGLVCLSNITCEDEIDPIITAAGTNGTFAVPILTLSATTDEPADCKYSETDLGYFSMRDFFEGNDLTHTIDLTLPEGSYTYFIRCKDPAGNDMNVSVVVAFIIDLPDNDPPIVSQVSPDEGMLSNQSLHNFTFMVSDESTIQNCSLLVDVTEENLSTSVTRDINQTLSANMTVGNHTWQVSCWDIAANVGSSFERNITIIA